MNRAGVIMILVGGAMLLWAATTALVYWDATRQRMSPNKRTLWMAAVALLPGAGFFAYLLVRMLNEFLRPVDGGSRLSRASWMTRVKRPQGLVKGSTIPASDLMQDPYPGAGPGPVSARPAAPAGGLWLVIVQGPDQGKAFPLKSLPAVIGRGQDVQAPLDADMGVSRRHAEIFAAGAWLSIRDLQSTHGTYVNGLKIIEKALQPGDQITIGQSILQIQPDRR